MSRWSKLWNKWRPNWIAVDYRPEWVKAVKYEGDELDAKLEEAKTLLYSYESSQLRDALLRILTGDCP